MMVFLADNHLFRCMALMGDLLMQRSAKNKEWTKGIQCHFPRLIETIRKRMIVGTWFLFV